MKKVIHFIAADLRIIIMMYVGSILLSSFLYHTFEGKPLFDALWWSCVTATTVGFGDYTAVTIPGRAAAMFFMHFWTFFTLPLLIGNVVILCLPDKQKFTHLEQEWIMLVLQMIGSYLKIQLPPPPSDN